MKSQKFILGLVFLFGMNAMASTGLVIHSAEFGVGKFHRYDNQMHPYAAGNAWAPYILPANVSADQPLITQNADHSVTIYFSTLDELLASVVKVSKERHQAVSVLNIHGHGLPGGMWFPKDAEDLEGFQCAQWKDAASGDDEGNYRQYYSAVSSDEIMQIRSMSNNSHIQMGCVSGVSEWRGAVAKNPEFKQVLADTVQLHFLSCVVGLGKMGQNFTQGVAALLLKNGSSARVEASMDFGLGDWSMDKGMGFWDYVTDAQIEHDNDVYPVDHRDSEIAQKGTVRMVTSSTTGWTSTLLKDRDFMSLGFETQIRGTVVDEISASLDHTRAMSETGSELATVALPAKIRIPGTTAYAVLK
jgi:hypothetical protein